MGYTILQRAGWSHPPQKNYLRQVTLKSWEHRAHLHFRMKTLQSSQALISTGFCERKEKEGEEN